MNLKKILPIAAAVGGAWVSGCGEGVVISDTPPPTQGPQREEPPMRTPGAIRVSTDYDSAGGMSDFAAGPDKTIGKISLRALNQRAAIDGLTLTSDTPTGIFGGFSLWNGVNRIASGSANGQTILFDSFSQPLALNAEETADLTVTSLLLGPVPSDFTLSIPAGGISAHDALSNEPIEAAALYGTFPLPVVSGRIATASLYATLSASAPNGPLKAGIGMVGATFDLTPYGNGATLDAFDLAISLGSMIIPAYIKNVRIVDESGALLAPVQPSITGTNPAAQYAMLAYALPANTGHRVSVVFDFANVAFMPSTFRASLRNIRATAADGTVFTIPNADGNIITIIR